MKTVPPCRGLARDIDWRFILPNPSGEPFEHVVLLGGSQAIEQTILDLGVARHVSHTMTTGVPADAVIGLAGTNASLSAAAQTLTENGVLYWEIDRRTPSGFLMTPARLKQQLTRLGLSGSTSYWVSRDFTQRLMYLPLNCNGALTWYLDTLFRKRTWGRRVIHAVLDATARYCGLSAITPCYAVTAVRGGNPSPAILAKAATEGVPVAQDAQAVFLAHGSTDWNRLVVLLFEPGGQAPTAAIKMPRVARFNREIQWEHDVLRTLNQDLPRELAESIPRSRIFRWNDLSVSIESCVSGASLNCRARPAGEGALNDLHSAVEWLARFHRHTTIVRVPAKQWARRHFDRVYGKYAKTFGLTAAEARLFDGLQQSIEQLNMETLPIVWQHADLGPPNLYLDEGKVSVIDWETARRGPPLQDLLYLVADWTAAVTGRTSDLEAQQNFRSLYCEDATGTFFDSVHQEIADYMQGTGTAASLFPVLLVFTFVDKALERVRRLTTLGRSSANRREGNRFVDYVGVLAAGARTHRRTTTTRITGADVSVAIATMNRPAALARCVEAILDGHMKPAELIVVDQGDHTATARLFERSGWRRILPLQHIRQHRCGLSASRNAAVAHASRPVVAFTDDDCVPDKEWLAGLMAGFNTAEYPDAVTGRVLPLGPEQPGLYAVSTRASETPALYRARTLPWRVGSGGNAAVKREWLERIGEFDERLGAGSPGQSAEDMDLFHRLLRGGASVLYHPGAVVYHERKDYRGRLASRPALRVWHGCVLCVVSTATRRVCNVDSDAVGL